MAICIKCAIGSPAENVMHSSIHLIHNNEDLSTSLSK